MNIQRRIDEARSRAFDWLCGMQAPDAPPGVLRSSEAHEVGAYPGMRLPATYNGWHCLNLIQAGHPLPTARLEAVGFVNSLQDEDGFYRIPGMRESDVFKREDRDYTWEYINFHVTNYSFGMVVALGETPAEKLRFLSAYETPSGFELWKQRRLWDDPWLEGNSVVNLAAFYDYNGLRDRFKDLVSYLDALQDPVTGYYGDDCSSSPTKLLHGMAGATHDYHLYFREGRLPPRHEQVVDSTLRVATEQLEGITSACLDIDVVDTLANLSQRTYRRAEIEGYLDRKLGALLDFQRNDGGFCDELTGTRTFDGWPRGYSEPQGVSNCFATWFRIATIGMIEWALYPEMRDRWTFRNTLGMGYFSPPRKEVA